ncbi:hypothetical protein HCBG_07086 [Histoplasma capsulatum G186AR]|uniref:Uncharacterized protein n=1 Tax=Ajellomyces capsulatus (strain G186AR / H82 / ATCC MYA-2454 / RMSCC 2432) TaxID=447093 RepID=C0NVA6_AJECG|nr:uncharacterized protein HCBG_07086 [Histoplasma capsulatum G186AR]EEH04445.1 hypothetical protein HCBG_07086 [Histoplasma capsulatum G186AR]
MQARPWITVLLRTKRPPRKPLWKFDHLPNTIPNINQSSLNYPALISSWVNVAALVALPASVPLGNAVANKHALVMPSQAYLPPSFDFQIPRLIEGAGCYYSTLK